MIPIIPNLPRIPLIRKPTPLVPVPCLAAAVGLDQLIVKREDLSGFAMGGNKPRQLEVILADARAADADTLVTTAAAQSNFCQTTAAAAAHLGLDCALLLRGQPDTLVNGNLLLDHIFGAEIEFIDTSDPYDPAIPTRLSEIADGVQARGGRPYIIHLPGRTGTLAAAAATGQATELNQQFIDGDGPPDILYLAVGSGLTAAGLIVGFKHLNIPTRVVGISVQQAEQFLKPLILDRANTAAALLGIDTRIDGQDFDIVDQFIGPGYGIPSPASLEAISIAGRYGALLVDPSYSGKALAGLIAHCRQGRVTKQTKVTFVHTGGTATLFAHAQTVAKYLAANRT
ncbi:MAG: 1-aminocyclopropane-1-carboxylate deaminase/D-cysteine desulfhydrase [Alphaproteobacteria bacterium]